MDSCTSCGRSGVELDSIEGADGYFCESCALGQVPIEETTEPKKESQATILVRLGLEAGAELERLFKAPASKAMAISSFAHPTSGGPLPKANVTRRFRKALKTAATTPTASTTCGIRSAPAWRRQASR